MESIGQPLASREASTAARFANSAGSIFTWAERRFGVDAFFFFFGGGGVPVMFESEASGLKFQTHYNERV